MTAIDPEIVEYLKKHVENIDEWVNIPLPVWGNKSLREYSKPDNKDYVLGTLHRIFE